MIVTPTTYNEQARHGWTHEATIELTDFNDTAATSLTLAVFNVEAGDAVQDVAVQLVTSLDGGATSATTITIGDGSDADAYVTATSIHADATPKTYFQNGGSGLPGVYTAADTVDVTFASTGGNLSVLTQGEFKIKARITKINA